MRGQGSLYYVNVDPYISGVQLLYIMIADQYDTSDGPYINKQA